MTSGQVLEIEGSLILNASSRLEFGIGDDGGEPQLVVSGNLKLNGQIVLVFDTTPSDGESITLIKAHNVSGIIKSIGIQQPDECKRVTATQVSEGAQVSFVISVKDVCGLTPWKVATITIACVIAAALLITGAMVLAYRRRHTSSLFQYHSMEDDGIR